MTQNELAGGIESAIEVDRRYHRLVDIGLQACWHGRDGVHPLAEEEEIAKTHFATESGTAAATNDNRFDFGEITFLIVGKAEVELLTRNQSQHGIAKKFQPFIRCKAGVGAGSVRQGRAQQFGLTKTVIDGVLAFLQN